MKRQLKKRQFMKRGMMGIYAAICAGMLLATGCAGTEPNVKKETPEKQEEVHNESPLQIQAVPGTRT